MLKTPLLTCHLLSISFLFCLVYTISDNTVAVKLVVKHKKASHQQKDFFLGIFFIDHTPSSWKKFFLMKIRLL